MEEFNKVITMYIDNTKLVTEANRSLTTEKRSFVSIFSKSLISESQIQLSDFYVSLKEADELYFQNFVLKPASLPPAYGGGESPMSSLASKSTVISNARDVFISSLSSFETSISNIESTLNFRLTTTIAIFAMVLSIMGML